MSYNSIVIIGGLLLSFICGFAVYISKIETAIDELISIFIGAISVALLILTILFTIKVL